MFRNLLLVSAVGLLSLPAGIVRADHHVCKMIAAAVHFLHAGARNRPRETRWYTRARRRRRFRTLKLYDYSG